jgi:hypothetical protein
MKTGCFARNVNKITVVLLFILFSVTTVAKADYNWIHFGSSYYALTQSYESWQDAENEAEALGGHLAVINSEEENVWLTTFIATERCRACTYNGCNIAWIGYLYTSGNWGWVNGDPVTYTNCYYSWPEGGIHAFICGAQHPNGAGQWGAHNIHDAISEYQPRGIIELASVAPTVQLSLRVEPNNVGINTVTPLLGDHQYTQNMSVKLKAEPYPVCPNVYQFDHWDGGVTDQNLADTTIVMDANKIVTAVFIAKRQCGDECHTYPSGDLNRDCIVNFTDFATFALNWLLCTKPECDLL